MKKLLLTVLMSLLFCGVVTASSINGDYKGNPIVKVTSNGKLLEVDEVPAQIYDGHTVVPISLLRQIGASVTWNQETYTVDVKLPTVQSDLSQTPTNKENSGMPKEEIDRLLVTIEVNRYLSTIHEMLALAAQIDSLLKMNLDYSSKRQVEQMIERLTPKKMDDFVLGIKTFRFIDTQQKEQLIQLSDSIYSMKQKYKNGQANLPEWIETKSKANLLRDVYDIQLEQTELSLSNKYSGAYTSTPK